jgi:hypothetical protein
VNAKGTTRGTESANLGVGEPAAAVVDQQQASVLRTWIIRVEDESTMHFEMIWHDANQSCMSKETLIYQRSDMDTGTGSSSMGKRGITGGLFGGS